MNCDTPIERLGEHPVYPISPDILEEPMMSNNNNLEYQQKAALESGRSYAEIANAATSHWAGTPAADPLGISSPSFQKMGKFTFDPNDVEDDSLFNYMDWYWRNKGKQQLIVNPPRDKNNFVSDPYFSQLHASFASTCNSNVYQSLFESKTFHAQASHSTNQVLPPQGVPNIPPIPSPKRSPQLNARHPRDVIPMMPKQYDENRCPPNFSPGFVDPRRFTSPISPGNLNQMNTQQRTENWFRHRRYLEQEMLFGTQPQVPLNSIDYELHNNEEPEQVRSPLSPISEETHLSRYRNYFSSPATAVVSRSDNTVFTPKKRSRLFYRE
uniref:Uncharacterized protein n=1 Tax=Panagrolaimus sp. JU765 TaxID=591449 RepID=A0AC34QJF6_9BILA